jgi:hypothetical protein
MEPEAVTILEENRPAGIAAKDYMIDCAGIMSTGFTWHEERISTKVRMSSLTPMVPPPGSIPTADLRQPGCCGRFSFEMVSDDYVSIGGTKVHFE